jgi:pSer/pThr/pTyr-binding forkhead associated (FHA) protein
MPRCSNCGRESPQGSIFCLSCGTRLVVSGAAAAVAAPPFGQTVAIQPGLPAPAPLPGVGPPPAAPPAGASRGPLPISSAMAAAAGPPPAAPPRTGPAPVHDPAAGARQAGIDCARCGADNPPSMKFCRECGGPLRVEPPAPARPVTPATTPVPRPGEAASVRMPSAVEAVGRRASPSSPSSSSPSSSSSSSSSPAAAPPAAAAARLPACPSCGGDTAPGFLFCQHCGGRLHPSSGASAVAQATPAPTPVPSPASPAAQALVQPVPAVESGRARTPAPEGRPPGVPARLSRRLEVVPEPAGDEPSAPPRAASAPAASEDAGSVETLPDTGPPEPARAAPVVSAIAGGPAWGRLVAVRQDGADGRAVTLFDGMIEIGRAAAIGFPDDRYLAPVHARIERRGAQAVLVPIDAINGVFRRVTDPLPLVSGDRLLLGRELLGFELIGDDERAVAPAIQHGIVRFGSPARAPWGRLVQLLANGAARDVRHLQAHDIVIGREEGDLVFRDDEFLSRRHAALHWRDGRCVVEDLRSSNGTFVRLRGEVVLGGREHLRMGNQLFRFEAAGG